MMDILFKRKEKKRNFKLESLYKDIKIKTIKVKRYHKDKDDNETPTDKDYCKMIKIDDLKKILEKHFGDNYKV